MCEFSVSRTASASGEALAQVSVATQVELQDCSGDFAAKSEEASTRDATKQDFTGAQRELNVGSDDFAER